MEKFEDAPLGSLAELIEEEFEEKNIACKCGGEKQITDYLSPLMMIDVSLQMDIRKIKISDIPLEITVAETTYAIKGCIEFIPGAKMGHYAAHVLRCNKHWEAFDDKLAKVMKTKTNDQKRIQVLFYVKK